ncbi:MAG: hypothetical protein R3C09_04605 [Pirellulaceae bacterium]
MNMVAKFELRDELKDSLTVLHDSLASQPLHGEGFRDIKCGVDNGTKWVVLLKETQAQSTSCFYKQPTCKVAC